MKISANWLKEYIKTDLPTDKMAAFLTDIGLEVEGVEHFESIKGSLEGIVVGKVLTCEQHPNADKLKKTTVDIGSGEPLQIVCGAPNVAAGQIVPVALIGTTIYKNGEKLTMQKAKIRGEYSEGMICAEDELGLSDDHGGIMILDESYEIGKSFADYYDLENDEVLEIGLTPNRTDAMSHYGVARDLHAFLSTNGLASDFEKISSKLLDSKGDHQFEIEVEDAELCPRYIGAIIENVKVEPSPDWLQYKLKAIGLSPINNIVDVTNYILHGYGQPLHAFDADKIQGSKVIVGNSPAGTKFTTLDGVERTLSGSEIMIKDGSQNPMCIAGVFGGEKSGVAVGTTRIFLESAYFNPVAIRKGAKHHGLNTDASFRFERGVDVESARTALTHAVILIEEIAGGSYNGPLLESYPEKLQPNQMVLRYSKLDQVLGVKIHREKVKEILRALDISVINEIADGVEVAVPRYRADVTREIDVIEEILRIYGYNKVDSPQKMSFAPVKLDFNDQDALENDFARLLQANGFNEVMNNSLTSVKDETHAVKLLNPLSNELSFMRKSLLEGMLANAVYNINRKSPDLKFFELGKIYHKKETYTERRQLALLVTGRDQPENWLLPKNTTDFYQLKSYVNLLLAKINSDVEEKPLEDPRFSEGLDFVSGNRTLARLGKVAPDLLKEFDLEQEAFYAELEIETLQKIRESQVLKFKEIPKFNKIRRDLALLVDKNISYGDLYRLARKNPSKYLKSINLFDVYEGKNLPDGKKSYAMSFELLNAEKTLEEKDISEVMNSLVNAFKKEFNAELRS